MNSYDYDLYNIEKEYKKFRDTQDTMNTLNNMGVFGQNTAMSNFADNFSNWGKNNAFFGYNNAPVYNGNYYNSSPSAISTAISDGGSSSAIGDAIGAEVAGNAGEGSSAIGDAIGAEVAGEGASGAGGGFGGGGGLGWISIAQNGMKGLQEGLDAGSDPNQETYMGGIGNGIQGFFGSNDYDNEIAQAIAGSGNGAKMGFGVGGPWGAVAGGILGLASSFIDDI